MRKGFTAAEIVHLEKGPFPGQIDPWAEGAQGFQSLHGEIISAPLAATRQPLYALGYVAGRAAHRRTAPGKT